MTNKKEANWLRENYVILLIFNFIQILNEIYSKCLNKHVVTKC